MNRQPTPDQRVAELASRQHGVFSRAQALAAGVTPRQIDLRLQSRRWLVALRGVYRMPGAPETWHQRVMAACLAGPSGTVASHLTAAALFGLAGPPPVPHVTVPQQAGNRGHGVVLHRATLEQADRCVVGAIPATVPGRMLVDCAGLVSFETLCHLVDTAFCRRLTAPATVRRAMARAGRRRKGLPALEEALAVWTPGPFFGSPAEARLLRQLQRWGVPRPERQYRIYDQDGLFVARVDLALPVWRFGLEYYGEEFHGPRQWETDDLRQDRIEALGWRIEPVDKFDLRPSSTRLRDLLLPLLRAA